MRWKYKKTDVLKDHLSFYLDYTVAMLIKALLCEQ